MIVTILLLLVGIANAQDPFNATYTKVINNGTGTGAISLTFRHDAVAFCHGDTFIVVNDPLTTMGEDVETYLFPGHENATCSATATQLFRADDTNLMVMNRSNEAVDTFPFGGSSLYSMSEVDLDGERVAICMTNGTVYVFQGTGFIQIDNTEPCRHATFTTDTNDVKTLAISTVSATGRIEFWVENGVSSYTRLSVVVHEYGGPFEMISSNDQGLVVAQSDGVLSVNKFSGSSWSETLSQGTGDIISWSVAKNDTTFMSFSDFLDPGLELRIYTGIQQFLSPVDEHITSIDAIAQYSYDFAYLMDGNNNVYRYGADLPTPATAAPTNSPTKSPTHSSTHSPTHSPTDAPTDAPTDTPTTGIPTASPTGAPTTDAPTPAPTEASTSDLALIIGLSAGGLVLSVGVIYFLIRNDYIAI